MRLAGGYHLVLAGLDRATVGIGQSVAAGAPVGWMPDGKQSPSELYLEVRERGAPVDPGRWLKLQAAETDVPESWDWVAEARDLLERYSAGEAVDLCRIPLDLPIVYPNRDFANDEYVIYRVPK